MSYRPRDPLPSLPTPVAETPIRAPLDNAAWECDRDGCEAPIAWLAFNAQLGEIEAWCKEHRQ